MINKKKLAVILPIYNEAEGIKRFYNSLEKIYSSINEQVEITTVLIDDGSSDSSWDEINKIQKENSNIIAIKFSRNFGKENAILAGLSRVDADLYLTMDSDGQHPPSTIPLLLKRILTGDIELVNGVKEDRGEETFTSKLLAKFFYKTLKAFSGVDLNNSSDFKLFTKKFKNEVIASADSNFFFRSSCEWVGFSRDNIYFTVAEREHGASQFGFTSLLKLGWSVLLSNSKVLLRLSSAVGVIFTLFSIILSINTLYNKLAGNALEGFTTIILFLSIQGAALFLTLGILGEYILRIYWQSKELRTYIIEYENNSNSTEQ